MPLTDLKIKALKPKDKLYRLADRDGLYLEVKPSGRKAWRLRYRRNGKNTLLSLGDYPTLSLHDARRKVIELKDELDASGGKRAEIKAEELFLFQDAAAAAFAQRFEQWRPSYQRSQTIIFEKYIRPLFHGKDIREIKRQDLITPLEIIAQSGKVETAHKVFNLFTLIFDYALLRGMIEFSPAHGTNKALPPIRSKPYAALTNPAEVGGLMRAIRAYRGNIIVQSALLLSAYTFCRPGEIRQAEWKEVDLAAGVWNIPADKAKMNRTHIVPLARQVRELMERVKVFTGHGEYIFPSLRTNGRPISDMTVNVALRAMGYSKEQMTAHGFRAMASTLLNERGHRHDVIEAQLAHAGYDKIRAIYNRAEYMEERRRLMQDWADYLDSLEAEI